MDIIFRILIWLFSIVVHKDTVLLVRFDGISDSLALGVKGKIESIFYVNVEIASGYEMPDSIRFTDDGKVIHANKTLRYLDNKFEADKVIAVTTKKLANSYYYYGYYTMYYYGMANPNGKACVISTCTLDTSALINQLGINAAHEIGHTYGLDHCGNLKCYMAQGDDFNIFDFCKSCKVKLKKLRSEAKNSNR